MSNWINIRRDYLTIQEKFKNIGSTNRSRWASFSFENTMSKTKFVSKLKFYGFDIFENNIDIIWDFLCNNDEEMQFSHFVKLIQTDVEVFQKYFNQNFDNLSFVEKKNSEKNEIFYPQEKNRKTVDDYETISNFDENFDEELPFEVLIHQNLPQLIPDCMTVDSKLRGEVTLRTFETLIGSLGINTKSSDWKKFIMKIDPNNDGIIPYFQMADIICQINSENEIKIDVEERNISKPKEPMNNKVNFSKPQFNEPDIEKYSENEIINEIIKKSNSFGGVKNVFQRWKGIDSKLTAKSIHEGLLQDGKINIPPLEIESIIKKVTNGTDSLSLPSFMRMVGNNNNDSQRSNNNINQTGRKMTLDDQAIQDIADQITNSDWETIIFKANTSDEIVRLLSEMGIEVEEATIRRLTSRLGRIGLIDAIKLRKSK